MNQLNVRTFAFSRTIPSGFCLDGFRVAVRVCEQSPESGEEESVLRRGSSSQWDFCHLFVVCLVLVIHEKAWLYKDMVKSGIFVPGQFFTL